MAAIPGASICPSTIALIQQQFDALIEHSLQAGLPPGVLARLVDDRLRQVENGYVAPEVGLATLVHREGGCVDVARAARLFSMPIPVTRQAVSHHIRNGAMIAYRTGGGQYRVPIWQFRPEGGVWDGLAEALATLRAAEGKAFDQLSPFAFFLQAHPLTAGKTPLDALRARDVASVLRAAESECT